VIQIAAPDHPLALTIRPDGSLDPGGTGPYQVHGRIVTGQNDDGDFTFAPLEQACNLGVLAPSKTIPSGSAPGAMTASSGSAGLGASGGSAAASAPPAAPGAGAMNRTPAAANAVLSVTSGFAAQAGAANPVAGRAFVLLRDSFDNVLTNGGFVTPAGASPYIAMIKECSNRAPDCQTATNAINAAGAAGARLDASGKATFTAVPPGTYYLMGAALVGAANPADRKILFWDVRVELRAGTNSVTLAEANATQLHP
jgi:hypothetical protein